MSVIVKGMDLVSDMESKLAQDIEELMANGVAPCLAIVRLGNRADDLSYQKSAVKRCEDLGIQCRAYEFPQDMSQTGLCEKIEMMNNQKDLHGILLFRPLPGHIDENVIKHVISPVKDVDCLSPVNIAKLFCDDESGYAPCTPEAVMEILESIQVDLTGKRVVVIGRSLVVGKSLAMLLLRKDATVTICHSKTKDLAEICRSADILIAAAGKAGMVNKSFVAPGQIVIDVGINVDANERLCGDVEFDSVEKIVEYITPVPGGVGTVTASVLAKHVIKAAKMTL